MEKEIFGLNLLSKKIPELLMKKVEDKFNPEKWNWKPFNPEKIKNIKKIVKEERKESNYAALTNYKPKVSKQNIVFIFSMGNLNYGLLKYLNEEKIKYFYLDYTQFILKGKINIVCKKNKIIKILTIDELEVDLNDIKFVLWNPPKYPYPLVDFEVIPNKLGRGKFLFRKRWAQFLKDFQHLLNQDVVWLPGDQKNGSQDWQNKIGEYNLAIESGLLVPDFIFTNKKETAIDFSKNNRNFLLREFCSPPYSFPPIRIENVTDDFFLNLETSPCTFQKYIEKKYELRIVVLFDNIYPCKIYSQDSSLANDDWRVHDDKNVKWELTNIPTELENKIHILKEKLNLNWCSVDMIYSLDNNYYFLEVNRPGAHYWLDMFVGLDISKEIVDQIKKRI